MTTMKNSKNKGAIVFVALKARLTSLTLLMLLDTTSVSQSPQRAFVDKDQLLQERQLLHDILVKREAVCLGVLGLYDVRNLMAILGKGLDVTKCDFKLFISSVVSWKRKYAGKRTMFPHSPRDGHNLHPPHQGGRNKRPCSCCGIAGWRGNIIGKT